MSALHSILSIEELDRFRNLLIFAKTEVEGFYSGKHKSRYHGASAEFSEYREYVAGDDAQRVDWRLYGRTRRLFTRHFQDETDMVAYVLLDTSGSMRYSGEGRQPKYLLAAKVAAALSYLMIRQGDRAALALFADGIKRYVPAGGTRRHLYKIISELDAVRPASTTGTPRALSDGCSVFKKRGRLVVISDFLDETSELFEALGRFMHRRFEILLLQILDPDELSLPRINIAKFVDLETRQNLSVEPDEIRRSYREQMAKHVGDIEREANARRISYQRIGTENSCRDALEAYFEFGTRKSNGARRGG